MEVHNGATIRDPAGNNADLSGAIGNPPGTLSVDTAYAPFFQLAINVSDPSAIVSVRAAPNPYIHGTYTNLGTGTIAPDFERV